jgi:ABC-type sugar transport system substrate-binding protein
MKTIPDLQTSPDNKGNCRRFTAVSRWPFRRSDRLVSFLGCLFVFGLPWGCIDGGERTRPDATYRVFMFTGSETNNPFWDLFAEFMRVAGKDLDIKVEVFFAKGSREDMAARIREVCEGPGRPDAIVVQSFKRNGLNSLRIANNNKVPIFLVNAGLTEEQKAKIREQDEEFPYWIGEMLPDDFGAGYDLAIELIDQARKDPKRLGPDGRVHVIGLNGTVSDGASVQRLAGLEKAIADRSDVATLDQVVSADWDQALAQSRCRVLHRRYPQASVIWCASDLMAIGAIEAMLERQRTPGQDVIIGGVDASSEAMNLIEEGTLSATVGGHFKDGGWVAVLIYDYFHGVKWSDRPAHFDSSMTLVTRKNLAEYKDELNPATWKRTDFHQFSHRDHPGRKGYRFELNVPATGVPTDDVDDPPADANGKIATNNEAVENE